MWIILSSIVFLGIAAKLYFFTPDTTKYSALSKPASYICLSISIFMALSTSFVFVPSNKVGHLTRVYFGEQVPSGSIIALPDEDGDERKGPQARLLREGLHFGFFLNVIYDVDMVDTLIVPQGKMAVLVAKDGQMLPNDRFIAPVWSDKHKIKDMIDAEYFLTNEGHRGPQYNVLPPAEYAINKFLWGVRLEKAVEVKTGYVGVVRSKVSTADNCPESKLILNTTENNGQVSTSTVPKNCQGVWEEPLLEGAYYLNPLATDVTMLTKRTVNWAYKGGYTRRIINLSIDGDENLVSEEKSVVIEEEKNGAGTAITVRTPDGWEVPVEIRVLAQVHPKNAASVVSTLGTLQNVEDNIITPVLRDKLRTVGGRENFEAIHFITKRDEISRELKEAVVEAAGRVGVSVPEVFLSEVAIPPELLLPKRREQLAKDLELSYEAEESSQAARVLREKTKSQADQQGTLMKAKIAKEAAEETKETLKLLGEGERDKMIAIAEGQRAQTEVLGQASTARLQLAQSFIEAAKQNPDIVKVPVINVGSSSGSMDGAAALLGGASNIATMMKLSEDEKKQKKGN